MNKVYNWAIIATVFALVSLGVMMFTDRPGLSWFFLIPSIGAIAMALIRYEDHQDHFKTKR